jgi:hypothetical protein
MDSDMFDHKSQVTQTIDILLDHFLVQECQITHVKKNTTREQQ